MGGQFLAKENHIRLQDSAADRAGGQPVLRQKILPKRAPLHPVIAGQTERALGCAVDVNHIRTACLLVQIVNVLGDNRLQKAELLEHGKAPVCGIGAGPQHLLRQGADPAIEKIGLSAEAPNGGHSKGIDKFPHAFARRAKIGNTRTCTDTRARKQKRPLRLQQKLPGFVVDSGFRPHRSLLNPPIHCAAQSCATLCTTIYQHFDVQPRQMVYWLRILQAIARPDSWERDPVL